MSTSENTKKRPVLESPQSYFTEVVTTAIQKRKFEAPPEASQYLITLLNAYLANVNFTLNSTLAEALMQAHQAEKNVKIELLKRLGDTSLYISGFFGDSLRRKIIDIDYYADIGGIAYANLAAEIESDSKAEIFRDISGRFLEYVDLLTYISQNTLVQSNQDLLRLYERYILTGSELAREQLIEKGLLTTNDLKKSSNQ
jgi:hypothetical protein